VAKLLALPYNPGACHNCTHGNLATCDHICHGGRLQGVQGELWVLDGCPRFSSYPGRKKPLYAANLGMTREDAEYYKGVWHV